MDSKERARGSVERTQGSRVVKSPKKKSKKAKKNTEMTPSALLVQAEQSLKEGRPDQALPDAKRALASLQSSAQEPSTEFLPALNLLAEINLELGDGDAAREFFIQAVDLDPEGTIPETQGGGAEKFLWLAQLSEDGGEDSVRWFEKGADVLKREIAVRMEGVEEEPDDAVKATMRKLAGALCGIVEIYMTDLSWDSSAETRCETLITEALLTSPHDPSTLQTLASIRISQFRLLEAQKALTASIDLWKDLPPSDSAIPDFPTRISLARLLMDVGMEETAVEVAERLIGEDDQSVEAWYLGGWGLYLLGQKEEQDKEKENGTKDRTMDVNNADKEVSPTTLISSREWLKQSLLLYRLLGYEDDRLRDHTLELVTELDDRLQGHDVDGAGGEDVAVEGDIENEGDGVSHGGGAYDEEIDST